MRTLLRACTMVSLLVLTPVLAQAQLSYTLTPTPLIVSPGATTTVSGTLTNTSGAPIYLNGAEERVLNTPGFAIDDATFYTNIVFPLNGNPLGAGDSVSGALFDITATSAPAGSYTLLFTVFGGSSAFDSDPLLPANAPTGQIFGTAQSLTVPEPGTVALLATLVTTGGVLLRNRKRRKTAA